MPLYEFACARCGCFSQFRSMADRDRPVRCPECSGAARRVVVAPNLALMSAVRRKAFAVNERSQHEPVVASRHTCAAGCGCGAGRAGLKGEGKQRTGMGGGLVRGRKGPKRPWMLGH